MGCSPWISVNIDRKEVSQEMSGELAPSFWNDHRDLLNSLTITNFPQ